MAGEHVCLVGWIIRLRVQCILLGVQFRDYIRLRIKRDKIHLDLAYLD